MQSTFRSRPGAALGRDRRRAVRRLRQHDRSTDSNYVAPDVDDLEEELPLVRLRHKRVRKYDG